MKHIKYFEGKNNIDREYKVDDIVAIDLNLETIVGKIIKNGFLYYHIRTANGEISMWVDQDLRYATESEIDKFEFESNTKKYNI